MSERTPGSGDEAMDLDILARDDMLLDALGRGGSAPNGDPVAAMLAAWHADLADDAPAQVRPAAPADVPTTGRPAPGDDPAAPVPPTPTSGGLAAPTPLPSAPSAWRRRPWAVRLAAAAVALLALAAGLGVSSRTAGPGSPLWSLTKVLYPQQAEIRDVEELITRARAALDAGRLDEAGQLVEQGRRELADVTDPAAVARLRAELDALARDLAAARAPLPPTAPGPSAPATRPAAPATGASAGGTPATRPRPSGSTTAPAPGSSSNDGGSPLPLPELPPSPLPSLSPLPGLPLPTGGLLD